MNASIFNLFKLFLLQLVFASVCFAATPSVVSTYPANAETEIDVSSTIMISFSEVMLWPEIYFNGIYKIKIYEYDSGLEFKAFSIAPASSDKDYILVLGSSLKTNTKYKVIIDRTVKSQSTEEGMSADYVFSFTTKTATDTVQPEVVINSPGGGELNVPTDSKVFVQFSEPMNEASITSSSFRLWCSFTGYLSASVVYDSSLNAVTLTPDTNLQKSTIATDNTCWIVADNSITDLAGNPLKDNDPVVWTNHWMSSFVVYKGDITPPVVSTTVPLKDATSVITGSVKIVFSEPIDESSLNISVVGPGSVSVAGAVSYDASSNSVLFTPFSAFANASDYTVTVNTAKDVSDNWMVAPYTFKFTTIQATGVASIDSYAQIPPFVAGAGLQPNVLFIVDNSGSMSNEAYIGSYVSTKNYYGYFDPNKMYAYSTSDGGYYYSTNTAPNKTSIESGNFLNWMATRRVDAVRMALVGGVKDSEFKRYHYPASSSYDITRTYSGKNFYVYSSSGYSVAEYKPVGSSSYSVRKLTVKITADEKAGNVGIIRSFKDKMRLGLMFFNTGYKFENGSSSDGSYMSINVGGTGDFADKILTTNPSTWTPLAESLYEAVRYFKSSSSAYNGSTSYASNTVMSHSCQKNFVIMLTDGESTKDMNLPGGKWGTPVSDSSFSVKNFIDGRSTARVIKGIRQVESSTNVKWDTEKADEGSWYLPAVAYYAHTNDLRSDFDGVQNMSIYTVFAFDDSAGAKELLKMTAKYGGFDDPDITDKDKQTSTFQIPAPNTTSKWDKNSDGIPDNYFEASDGDLLQAALDKALNDILTKISSGTAASILNNSSGSGANLLQAMFYPKKNFDSATEVTWVGELQNLWYYIDPYLLNSSIRVDTVQDNKLNLKQDDIAQFEFDGDQTKVYLYKDSTGDGKKDTTTAYANYNPDDSAVKSLWKAGRKLWERDVTSDPRTIYTHVTGLVDSSLVKPFNDPTSGLALLTSSLVSGFSSRLTYDPYFQQMLQVANSTEAAKLLDYVHGVPEGSGTSLKDISGYRSRLAQIGTTKGIWRLGDIVDSTPKLIANVPLNSYAQKSPTGYNDSSYDKFSKSADYSNRGMVVVGANDGMLHAFRLGKFAAKNDIFEKATLTGSDLGREEWAFVPKNMLPYLRYLADPQYSHLFYVDGSTLVIDAAVHAPSNNDEFKNPDNSLQYPDCDAAHYWKCKKTAAYSNETTKVLDTDKTSWRTILIGSAGLGGAARNRVLSGHCYEKQTVNTSTAVNGTHCIKTPVDALGYSSYYALDVTDPANPKFLWEFNGDPTDGTDHQGLNSTNDRKGGNLGYATSGPAIVRIGDTDKNGRWFAVFGSGPTGPIIDKQFKGNSDQPLRFFIVDIGTGKLVKTINTGIENAFSGSLSNSTIDADRSNTSSSGFYKDDAIYAGYTQKTSDANKDIDEVWQKGGVGRIFTNESEYPDTAEDSDAATKNKPWMWRPLITGIGPVTTAVTKLQDRKNGKLWTYFGTGRYYFKSLSAIDDASSRRSLYGIIDPCYDKLTNDIDHACTTTVARSDLQDQTNTPTTFNNTKGWRIDMDNATADDSAERVITNPTAMTNGIVLFTSFLPTNDVCKYGGSSYIWAVGYNSGGAPSSESKNDAGKIMIQVSTGAFKELSLATDFTGKDGRRLTTPLTGVPPKEQGISSFLKPKPVKKILQVIEK